MSSKKIFIKPIEKNLLFRQNTKDVKEYLKDRKLVLGSEFESLTNSKIKTGLSYEEEEFLIPYIIKIAKEDIHFKSKVEEYYLNFDVSIPYSEKGLELEIGLEKDNKPLIYETENQKGETVKVLNSPINITQYLKYRYCLVHSQIGKTEDESIGNPFYTAYIFDPDEKAKKQVNLLELADESMSNYLSIAQDDNKVAKMLRLFNIDIVIVKDKNIRRTKLKELAQNKPSEFIKLFNDEDLDLKFKITRMVDLGVLSVIGDAPYYKIKESQETIAAGMQEAVEWFKRPSNSATIQKLESEYEVYRKNNIVNK